ncbi:MAG: amphi-Trp domain-containing protein [bacterium]|nr:amphi-Trp domain-containing protein [bacterium]
MNKKSITVKTSLKKDRAIAYLEELTKSLKTGQVCIQQENEFVALSPVDQMELEVSAAQKKGKEKLTFELSWVTETPELPADNLVISSTTPKVTPAAKKEEPKKESATKAEPAKGAAAKPAAKATN